ncbi:hypothetical protein [Nocardia sp. AB354]|uniref:hypothetical protein n=1 Tax=Nocardia sp. AB354 TaxID=3413283 RepID=UPI003C19BEB6
MGAGDRRAHGTADQRCQPLFRRIVGVVVDLAVALVVITEGNPLDADPLRSRQRFPAHHTRVQALDEKRGKPDAARSVRCAPDRVLRPGRRVRRIVVEVGEQFTQTIQFVVAAVSVGVAARSLTTDLEPHGLAVDVFDDTVVGGEHVHDGPAPARLRVVIGIGIGGVPPRRKHMAVVANPHSHNRSAETFGNGRDDETASSGVPGDVARQLRHQQFGRSDLIGIGPPHPSCPVRHDPANQSPGQPHVRPVGCGHVHQIVNTIGVCGRCRAREGPQDLDPGESCDNVVDNPTLRAVVDEHSFEVRRVQPANRLDHLLVQPFGPRGDDSSRHRSGKIVEHRRQAVLIWKAIPHFPRGARSSVGCERRSPLSQLLGQRRTQSFEFCCGRAGNGRVRLVRSRRVVRPAADRVLRIRTALSRFIGRYRCLRFAFIRCDGRHFGGAICCGRGIFRADHDPVVGFGIGVRYMPGVGGDADPPALHTLPVLDPGLQLGCHPSEQVWAVPVALGIDVEVLALCEVFEAARQDIAAELEVVVAAPLVQSELVSTVEERLLRFGLVVVEAALTIAPDGFLDVSPAFLRREIGREFGGHALHLLDALRKELSGRRRIELRRRAEQPDIGIGNAVGRQSSPHMSDAFFPPAGIEAQRNALLEHVVVLFGGNPREIQFACGRPTSDDAPAIVVLSLLGLSVRDVIGGIRGRRGCEAALVAGRDFDVESDFHRMWAVLRRVGEYAFNTAVRVVGDDDLIFAAQVGLLMGVVDNRLRVSIETERARFRRAVQDSRRSKGAGRRLGQIPHDICAVRKGGVLGDQQEVSVVQLGNAVLVGDSRHDRHRIRLPRRPSARLAEKLPRLP